MHYRKQMYEQIVKWFFLSITRTGVTSITGGHWPEQKGFDARSKIYSTPMCVPAKNIRLRVSFVSEAAAAAEKIHFSRVLPHSFLFL